MEYYGLHWTSDDGTEIQIRVALENLELWARSCPRGGEWSAWRRLDVVRGIDGVLRETTQKALSADSAKKSASAASADVAERAKRSDSAASADTAKRAESAAKADNAAHASKADTADNARTADTAKRLSMAVSIALAGTVTGSTLFDGINNVTIQTKPGKEITDLQSAIAKLQQTVGGLAASISGINGANGNLASQIAQLGKRLAALESKGGEEADKELLSSEIRLIHDKVWRNFIAITPRDDGNYAEFGEYWADSRIDEY